jgi:hypothetical protein
MLRGSTIWYGAWGVGCFLLWLFVAAVEHVHVVHAMVALFYPSLVARVPQLNRTALLFLVLVRWGNTSGTMGLEETLE